MEVTFLKQQGQKKKYRDILNQIKIRKDKQIISIRKYIINSKINMSKMIKSKIQLIRCKKRNKQNKIIDIHKCLLLNLNKNIYDSVNHYLISTLNTYHYLILNEQPSNGLPVNRVYVAWLSL